MTDWRPGHLPHARCQPSRQRETHVGTASRHACGPGRTYRVDVSVESNSWVRQDLYVRFGGPSTVRSQTVSRPVGETGTFSPETADDDRGAWEARFVGLPTT